MNSDDWKANPGIPVWWSAIKLLETPLLLINKDNRIIGSNEALQLLLGYSANELKHKTLVQITREEDRVKETNTFIDVFYGKIEHSSTIKKFVSADGRELTKRQYLFPVRNQLETLYALAQISEPHQQIENQDIIEQIEPILNQLKSTLSFIKLNEFGFSYKKSVVQQAEKLVQRIQKLISEPVLQPV